MQDAFAQGGNSSVEMLVSFITDEDASLTFK